MARLFLFEADDDNAAGATNNGTATDNSSNNEDQTGNDNSTDNTNQTDDGNKSEEGDDQSVTGDAEDFGDEDFTISDDNAEGQEDSNQDDQSGESAGDGISGGEDNNNPPLDPDSLKAKDRQLFDSLSIPEQQIKVKELKKLFGELYANCNNIVDRFNSLSLEMEEIAIPIRRAMNTLFDLKNMISFYIMNIYDTKSYIENDIAFNRYLLILNSVKNVINEVKNGINDDIKEE